MDNSNDSVFVGILKPGLPGPRFARAGAVNSPGLKPRANGGINGLHRPRANGGIYGLHWPRANGGMYGLHLPRVNGGIHGLH